jgi:hypothetical protein
MGFLYGNSVIGPGNTIEASAVPSTYNIDSKGVLWMIVVSK